MDVVKCRRLILRYFVSARYRKPGERKKKEMQIYLHVGSIFFHILKGVYCVLGLHESKREQNFQQKTGRLNLVQQCSSGLSCQPLPVMKQEMMEPFRKAQILNGVRILGHFSYFQWSP